MVFVALITGGASGLGYGCAKWFVKCGRYVVICDLPTSNGAKVAKELGDMAFFIPCDVTIDDDVMKMMKTIKDKFGRLDIVVNCAGVFFRNKIYDADKKMCDSMEVIKQVYNVNVFGTYNVCRLAAAIMAENETNAEGQRGIIICASSCMAYEAPMYCTAYASTKTAISGIILPMSRELGQFGIRVMGIAPGVMDTPLHKALPKTCYSKMMEDMAFPKRMGTPEDFAKCCEAIVENCYFNGCTIRCDAGIRMKDYYFDMN